MAEQSRAGRGRGRCVCVCLSARPTVPEVMSYISWELIIVTFVPSSPHTSLLYSSPHSSSEAPLSIQLPFKFTVFIQALMFAVCTKLHTLPELLRYVGTSRNRADVPTCVRRLCLKKNQTNNKKKHRPAAVGFGRRERSDASLKYFWDSCVPIRTADGIGLKPITASRWLSWHPRQRTGSLQLKINANMMYR